MSETNYLGMPIVVEPIWEDALAATGIDPLRVAAEAETITLSRWDEIMKKEKPNGPGQVTAAGTPRRDPGRKRVPQKRTAAKRPQGPPPGEVRADRPGDH